MTIGELLKQKRLENNKTQKAWVGDIVSPSYYAKVEKNQHRISAEDLIAILKQNDVDVAGFFKDLQNEEDNTKKLENEIDHIMIQAVYNKDTNRLKALIPLIDKCDWSQKTKDEYHLIIKGMIESTKLDIIPNYDPDKKVIQDLKDRIFSIPDFNQFKLEMFGNFMIFYDWQTNIFITNQILKQFDNKNDNKELLAISAILSNLISQLVEAKQYDKTKPFFDAAEKIPATPELYFTRTVLDLHKYVVAYHYNHQQGDLDKAKLIAKTYQVTGFKEFSKTVQHFINQEIERLKEAKK